MVRTVNEAFGIFLGWLTPTSTESQSATSHRASIDACLRSNFGSVRLFRSGSYGHHTSVSGCSDVDYFAVFPRSQLTANSTSTLVKVKNALDARFPNTGVNISNPAVTVPFGNTVSERHEIIPADYVEDVGKYGVYDISDRQGGWMRASPLAHNDYVNYQQVRLGNKVKPLIRFLKKWNYEKSVGIRSFYMELRTTEYVSNETVIIYRLDVLRALKHLKTKQLAAMQDPKQISGYVYPCTEAVKTSALSKLDTAVSRANNACNAETSGNIEEAFYYWNLLFGGTFPSYY